MWNLELQYTIFIYVIDIRQERKEIDCLPEIEDQYHHAGLETLQNFGIASLFLQQLLYFVPADHSHYEVGLNKDLYYILKEEDSTTKNMKFLLSLTSGKPSILFLSPSFPYMCHCRSNWYGPEREISQLAWGADLYFQLYLYALSSFNSSTTTITLLWWKYIE